MQTGHFALILAAGKGTRMRSPQPKVLRSLLGQSMLALVLAAAKPVFGENILIVCGHGAPLLRNAFPSVRFVEQTEQLGTGHALKIALPALSALGATRATIINGDVPLIEAEDFEAFLKEAASADLAFATISLDDPGAYGRVVRKNGEIAAIVEAKDYDIASFGQPSGEVNAGLYDADILKIAPLLDRLGNDNKSGEYYLTDLIALALAAGLSVKGVPRGRNGSLLGVNSPLELAAAEDLLAARVNNALLESGVILHHPAAIRIAPCAHIEPGAEISGPTRIFGNSSVEAGAVIDSHCVLEDSMVQAGAHVRSFSHLEGAVARAGSVIGPYARLRPGAEVCENAHVGNFVELKKARLGPGAKACHLTYLGDADVGAGSNIGAGTITCNYDGKAKHQTNIGEKAFIGSNSALVAPVNIGAGALVGAGSVITKDVPPDDLAIARGKQKNMPRKKL